MEVKGRGVVYHGQFNNYTITDNQKKIDGTYDKFYIPVSFPKSMTNIPHNGDFIEIVGFTKPYKYKDGKLGISYMITEWNLINARNTQNNVVQPQTQSPNSVPDTPNSVQDSYTAFGEEFQLTSDDLPF